MQFEFCGMLREKQEKNEWDELLQCTSAKMNEAMYKFLYDEAKPMRER